MKRIPTSPIGMPCFVHIERAGGTTLHTILKNNSRLSHFVLKPWYYHANVEGNWLPAKHLRSLMRVFPNVRSFGGHTVRSFLDYEGATNRSIGYVTFLRNPISRWLSHFDHQRNVKRIDWTINDFLADEHYANFQTVRICGTPDVEKAKRELEKYAFVGLADRYDEGLVMMRRFLGIPDLDIRYDQRNATPMEQATHIDERSELMARIREKNMADLALYEHVQNVLYPAFQRAYGQGLTTDLARFESENTGFSFNPVKLRLWKLERVALHRPVEWILHKLA